MTRMTGPDCVVMCNLINTYIHTYIHIVTTKHAVGWKNVGDLLSRGRCRLIRNARLSAHLVAQTPTMFVRGLTSTTASKGVTNRTLSTVAMLHKRFVAVTK